MGEKAALRTDIHGVASLDGPWDFFPGDHDLEALEALAASPIRVPGLWEAQGHLELDGAAWYRRRFRLEKPDRHWTLRFGAVMDFADVYLNRTYLGSHHAPFTPFEFDVSGTVRGGDNVLHLRVVDPPVESEDHLRLAHGKEGWANHVFPSRPSLYMTYGGIWQPVTLRRHGPVAVRDVFVNGDPDRLSVTVEVENVSGTTVGTTLLVQTLGLFQSVDLQVAAGERRTHRVCLGSTDAPRWAPEHPTRHGAVISALVGNVPSDACSIVFGLRTVRVEGKRMLINGTPYRMKSALVQGFRADGLYAEGDRGAIAQEVTAAQQMGFNTLRLHIKAFDPTYLDVCDELGMLVHCDIPVAEPIAHEEMGDGTLLSRRCQQAAVEQVRRDRNHPSIILWSAMNELCLDRLEARAWDRYEQFARALVGVIRDLDPTRPVIENDWVEPDPERVFLGTVLTAHWYGRLHAEYLATIERKCLEAATLDRPLCITEFGDWGLPQMPRLADPPFWDTRAVYAVGLAATLWPGTIAEFVTETQRYQGLSDRLQIEVFRRHDHIGGYCLTELTDVPHELNGLLDLHRRPKSLAVTEVTRANQTVLPILRLASLVARAGDALRAELWLSNDGPPLDEVTVEVAFGGSPPAQEMDYLLALDASALPASHAEARFEEGPHAWNVGSLRGWSPEPVGSLAIPAPLVPGTHDLRMLVRVAGRRIAENRYPIHVVTRAGVAADVHVIGGRPLAGVLSGMGSRVLDAAGTGTVTIIAEGALAASTADVASRLEEGGTVLVLAQTPETVAGCPVPLRLTTVATAWGSSMFHFTTDEGALPSLPRRAVLAGEDSTIQAASIVAEIGSGVFPDSPVVIAYKPVPDAMTGTVIGSHDVGSGRLVFCQYRLTEPALAGDALARALLCDLVAWAAHPPLRMGREVVTKEDGRKMTFYSWQEARTW